MRGKKKRGGRGGRPGGGGGRAQGGGVSREEVLAAVRGAGRPVSVREIARAMGQHGRGIGLVGKAISKLRQAGLVKEVAGGKFVVQGAGGGAERPVQERREGAGRAAGERAPVVRSTAGILTGRLVAHRDGYGFVVPEKPVTGMDGDLFIGRDGMGDAMHGDRVEAQVVRWSQGRGAGEKRAEGRVVRILDRAHPSVVGVFRYGDRGNVVAPYEARIQQEIVIPAGDELTPALREKLRLGPGEKPGRSVRMAELDGAVVNVELVRYPKAGVAPSGRVVEVLGKPGELGVDVEIIIRKHHLPHTFPGEVKAEAGAVPQEVREQDRAGREDFRSLPIVTIDGETAKDFDDAVYVKRLGNGHWELQVHIADVSHYVRRETALDREARLRGTSVYFPNRAVPMLPEELSNEICSLKPQVERLVMSAVMEMDASGQVVGERLTAGVIRSAERMTYTNVNKVIEGDAEMRERYAPLVEQFLLMKELALILNAKRRRRGSIDFDLPERLIEFDEMGRMVTITRGERNIAHRLIEEFMLAANETVDRWLLRREIASLHRVHEKPDPKKVIEFEELAHAFGYSMGLAKMTERRVAVRHGAVKPQRRGARERPMALTVPEEVDIRPQHYQRVTEQIAGKPEERILSYLMLRSLKQARYSEEPLGHFALAVKEYAHFTSPIRRYPDLIVHRVLKWALEEERRGGAAGGMRPGRGESAAEAEWSVGSRGPYTAGVLKAVGDETSDAERRAADAERELVDWKTAQFMESRLGDEFEALVISVQKFGFFVELMEIFVEGLVPVTSLERETGERWFYKEQEHVLVSGRAKKSYKLGDMVRVRAERIDPIKRKVEFAVV